MRYRLSAVIFVAALLQGCGGGGGGSPAPSGSSLLSGTYGVSQFSGTDIPPLQVTGSWGLLEADGIDASQMTLTGNRMGTIMPLGAPQDMRYGVGVDRTLAFRIAPFPFLDFLTGGISSNGEVAAVALNLLGGTGIYLLVRHGNVPTLQSLNGPYHVVGYSYNDAVAIQTGWVGVVTFDGAGGGTLSAGINNNGNVGAYGPAGVTYAVAADGGVTLDLGNNISVTGRLTADGQLLLAAGSTTPGGPPSCFAFLRAGTAMTDADFDGFYHTVTIGRDMTSLDHFNGSGATFPQGDGNIGWYLFYKDESVQTVLDSDSGTYTVISNGSVVVTTPIDALRGAVSADGQYAILGRLGGPDPDPSFWLLLR